MPSSAPGRSTHCVHPLLAAVVKGVEEICGRTFIVSTVVQKFNSRYLRAVQERDGKLPSSALVTRERGV